MATLKDFYAYDDTLFDDIELPDGVDKVVLVDSMMLQCGLLDLVYDEPGTFKQAMTIWFKRKYWNINKLVTLINIEYSPLENYDRHEEYSGSDTYGSTLTDAYGHIVTDAHGHIITDAHGHVITDVDNGHTSTNTISADNSSTYSPDSQNTTGGTQTTTNSGSDTQTHSGSDSETHSGSDTQTHSGTDSNAHTLDVNGNIGTMSSQNMFNQEADIANKFNMYDMIVDMFESDLVVTVF